MNRSVLITGAAGGLGAATAEEFADHGWDVFAADLVAPVANSRQIPIALDVTDNESCAAAAQEITRYTGGLGAVVNFAGILDLGPLMEVSEERLRRILDINVLGTHRVNLAMFPLVQAGAGRIVNISSEAGRFRAGLTSGPYSMSKHAIEAYSDALRQELMFLDIPVITIEPGSFRTPMSQGITARMNDAKLSGSPFAPLVAFTSEMGGRDERNARDPRILARAVYRAVVSPRPKPRYLVNGALSRKVMERVPRPILDRLIKVILQRRFEASRHHVAEPEDS
jgi:NAD(P)-dependent dehydrogenase (short-subunit alcohol dehydrogenase family)